MLRPPPDAPARLSRLPVFAAGTSGDLDALAALLRRRRFRVVVRDRTVSAEKGYLKETGNLLFHFALLALLVGVATSSWYGWHGSRNLVAGADQAFCDTLPQYDDQGLGARVRPGDLPPFCLQLDRFDASYQPDGQAKAFTAYLSYSGVGSGTAAVRVNHPLEI